MKVQCKAHIWKPETYRRTGRGPSGFQMHYQEMQCSRTAKENGYCWQHQWIYERDRVAAHVHGTVVCQLCDK